MEQPDVIEVEVERLEPEPTRLQGLLRRARRVVAPLAVGALVDVGDFLAFGPLGAVAMPLGMLAGYVISGLMGAAPTWRIVLAVTTGIYCALPLDWLPLATTATLALQLVGAKALASEPLVRR